MTIAERLEGMSLRPFYECDRATVAEAARLLRVLQQQDELLEALEAIVARWDTPAWKDVESTAEVVNRARAAINKARDQWTRMT